MKKILTAFYLILFISSCANKNSDDGYSFSMPEFKSTKVVTPTYISIDSALSDTYFMHVNDKYVFFESYIRDNGIQLYDKQNGKYVTSIAPLGRGPGEYPMTVDLMFIGDTLCIYDRRQCIINYYNKDFLTNRLPIKKTKLMGANGYFRVVPTNSGFITIPTRGSRFISHNKNGEYIESFSRFPIIKGIEDTTILHDAIYGGTYNIAIKPDYTKLVTATFRGAMIEIFSINNNKLSLNKEVRLLPPILLHKKDNRYTASNECSIGFWNIKTTDKYIYMIFSGKKLKEHKKRPTADYIHVYDWNGAPVKSYRVAGGLTRFALDEKQERIYILTLDKNDNEIIGYFDIK